MTRVHNNSPSTSTTWVYHENGEVFFSSAATGEPAERGFRGKPSKRPPAAATLVTRYRERNSRILTGIIHTYVCPQRIDEQAGRLVGCVLDGPAPIFNYGAEAVTAAVCHPSPPAALPTTRAKLEFIETTLTWLRMRPKEIRERAETR